jgi:hypothetical protein
MNDVLAVLLVTVTGAVLVGACSTGLSRRERSWVWASFSMHLSFAFAQVPLVLSFFRGGDMFLYFSYGEILAQMMQRDPYHVVPEVTALLLHNRPHLPLVIIGAGTATGSMSALAAWTFYVLGPSKYAACIAFAILSLCGKVALYRVFRANVDSALRWPVAIAALFVPSFVFWSSGLIKEAVVVGGLGWSVLGIHLWIREGRPIPGWALIVAGAVPMSLIKPYTLFPLVLAGGSWYYWARSLARGRVRIRPLYFTVAAVLGVGGIVVLGQQFPEYALDTFSARSTALQELGRRGGSSFALSGETATSLLGQFAFAPAALLTSLFRPFLFEVHNLPTLVNALETTVLMLLFVRVLFTGSLRKVRRQIADNPFLVFCLVFVIAFGIAVGLASSNLGTLSRYRIPLVPFFVLLLVALGKPIRARSPARDARRGQETVLGAA